jgi:hypothetical protein
MVLPLQDLKRCILELIFPLTIRDCNELPTNNITTTNTWKDSDWTWRLLTLVYFSPLCQWHRCSCTLMNNWLNKVTDHLISLCYNSWISPIFNKYLPLLHEDCLPLGLTAWAWAAWWHLGIFPPAKNLQSPVVAHQLYHMYATTRYNFVRLKATHKISPLEELVGGRSPP